MAILFGVTFILLVMVATWPIASFVGSYISYKICGKIICRSFLFLTPDNFFFSSIFFFFSSVFFYLFIFFAGIMPPSEYKLLQTLAEEAETHDHAFWFGHYPTSCILGPDQGWCLMYLRNKFFLVILISFFLIIFFLIILISFFLIIFFLSFNLIFSHF